jgi:hypothetical protein
MRNWLFLVFLGCLHFLNKRLIVQRTTPKTIWIYWEQGWEEAPLICRYCLRSWQKYNPTWRIITLDRSNVEQYLELTTLVPNVWEIKVVACRSDIIRINLLRNYGGVWVDATTFCTRPLDEWLHKHGPFFAFVNPSPDRMLANWFMYSSRRNYIVEKWCDTFNEYWKGRDRPEDYFVMHHIFKDLYETDYQFKKQWTAAVKVSAALPHALKYKEKHSAAPLLKRTHIALKMSPLYKLDHNEFTSECLAQGVENIYTYLILYHRL